MIDDALYTRLNDDTALTALVAARIFPGVVPIGEAFPAIAYNQISQPRTRGFGNDDGPVQPRFQFDVIAKDTEDGGSGYLDCREVKNHIIRLLNRWQGSPAGVLVADSQLLEDQYTFDERTKRHRWRMDFQIFATEYTPLLFQADFNAHLATFTRSGTATYNDK